MRRKEKERRNDKGNEEKRRERKEWKVEETREGKRAV